MKIGIGNDHVAVEYKKEIKKSNGNTYSNNTSSNSII